MLEKRDILKDDEDLFIAKVNALVSTLKGIGVSNPFNPDNVYVVHKPNGRAFRSNNILDIVFQAMENGWVLIGARKPILDETARLHYTLDLEHGIAEHVYSLLAKYPSENALQYAFYEGHITFKQYNTLTKKLKAM